MKCHELEELLTPYIMGDLDDARAEQVRSHLESCEGCQAAVQELELTLGLLRDAMAAHPVEQTELEPERVEAVKAQHEEPPAKHRAPEASGHGARRRAKKAKEETTSRAWWQFRIVEVAAVLLIVGLMAGLLAPALSSKTSNSRVAKRLADQKQREMMQKLAMSESNADLDDVVMSRSRTAPEAGEELTMEVLNGRIEETRALHEELAHAGRYTEELESLDDMPAVLSDADYELARADNARKSQVKDYDEMYVGNELGVDGPEEEPIKYAALEIAESEEEIYRYGGAKDDKELYAGRSRGRRVSRDLDQVAGERSQDVDYDSSEVFYEGGAFELDAQLAQGKSSRSDTFFADGSVEQYPGSGDFLVMDDDRREADLNKQVPEKKLKAEKKKLHIVEAPSGRVFYPPEGEGRTASRAFERGPAQQETVGGVAGSDIAVAYNAAAEKAPHRSNMQASEPESFENYEKMAQRLSAKEEGHVSQLIVRSDPPEDAGMEVASTGGRQFRHMGWEDPASPPPPSAGAYEDRSKANGAKVVDSYAASPDVGAGGHGDEADLVMGLVASRIEEPKPVTKSEAKGRAELDLSSEITSSHEVTQREADAEEERNEATFKAYGVNPFVLVSHAPFSTFSMDVDTASYTLTRNYIRNGRLPPAEAVRTEEFVNFFDYEYAPPKHGAFAVSAKYAPSPFGRGSNLLKIGVKGQKIGREHRKSAVLTFVIDTSGSMNTPDRLGLLQESLRMLVGQLDAGDRVAIVQYDSEARLVLEHTPVFKKDEILKAIDTMQTSGSTHLEEGLKLGYGVASKGFKGGAMNRVLLLSDGVANLGSGDAEEILGFVERYRDQGVYCSVYGFGIGTYDDEMLETLANKGDGSYHFIDSSEEAKRVFVDELSATLNVIAKDAKIQVEFNPERVKSYRQVGYENRLLTEEQFRDDSVDAGEVGSGQSVTALYELDLHGSDDAPIGTVRVRYRDASSGEVTEFAYPIEASDMISDFEKTGPHFKLATAVAEYAEILRGSPFADGSTYEDVAKVLRPVSLELKKDQRVQELLRMVQGSSTLPRAEYGKKDIVLE